jgi:hypothetical protein
MNPPRAFIQLAALLPGSALAGFLIGTLQHYLGFGIWGFGFGRDVFWFALFEGGVIGTVLAIPTGLVVFYAVLKARVTLKQVVVIFVASLVGGCAFGIMFSWISVLATPVLTVCVAVWFRLKDIRARTA